MISESCFIDRENAAWPEADRSCRAFAEVTVFRGDPSVIMDSAKNGRSVLGPGTETMPNQGSRALIIQQTCRGSFSVVWKLMFASQYSFTTFKLFATFFKIIYKFWMFCTAPHWEFANFGEIIFKLSVSGFFNSFATTEKLSRIDR